jgi:carboxyl-terminal processing protease
MNTAFAHVRRLRGLYLSALAAALAVVSIALVRPSSAELTAPTPDDQYVTKTVTFLLGREHLSKHKLDDEISQRTLKTFLRQLDPMKLYFTQGDIDEFSAKEFQLDDMALKGDVSMAYTIFNRYLERMEERLKLVDELLKMKHDFTVDEEMVTDSKLTVYAKNDDEVREKWRKRIKFDLLVQKAEKVEGGEAVEKLHRRYQSLGKRMHQIDHDDLLEMYITAMTSSFDPHTSYMSKSTYESFIIMMRLELEGIGASLQYEDGYTKVKELIPGGSADKDGRLKPEDRIIGVAQGKDGEFVDVVDMNLNDVVKLIRGTPGTVVRLKVIPTGKPEPKVYDITRARIELKDKEARAEIIQDGKKSNGEPYNIGVIELPSFYEDMEGRNNGARDYKSTTRDVQKILQDFRSKNVDGVILDLRRNGGGSLTEAIDLTGLFIDYGPVVQVKDSNGRVEQKDDLDRGVAWDGPLVVLTSKFSASASEILAGAIQDYRRGIVVGDKSTHGKGTVQSLLDLGRQLFRNPNAPSLGALKITMQQFYRPNGDSTQNRGVLADVELPSLTTHLDMGEAELDYALKFDHVEPASFQKEHRVDAKLIDELRRRSQERVAKSEEFAKELHRIESYKRQKDQKRISLNEAKFLADRAELNPDKEEEKKFEELNGSPPVFKRDFYNNEALAITLDLLNLKDVSKITKR